MPPKSKLSPQQTASNAAIEVRQHILELRSLHAQCVSLEVLRSTSETCLEKAFRALTDAVEALDPLI